MTNAPDPSTPPEALAQDAFLAIQRAHTEWLMSEGKEGRRASFRDADLRFVDFADANLLQASFRNADLRGCDLTGAQLQEADFTEARLDSANLSGVNLERSNFASASLERAILDGANAAAANFLNANLTDASLRHTSLPGAVLRQAIANRALFEHTNLTDANARQASLQDAKFHSAQLVRADLRESRCDQAEFVDVRFDQTQFKAASLEGVSFTESDFSQALEVSQEYKSAALQEARGQLERERSHLQSREDSVRKDLITLETQKAVLLDLNTFELTATERLTGMSGQLKIVAVIWGAVAFLLIVATGLGVSSLPAGSVSGLGILLVVGVPMAIVALSLFAMLRVRAASRMLQEQAQLRERKLFTVHSEKNESTLEENAAPIEAEMPAPMSLDARFSM